MAEKKKKITPPPLPLGKGKPPAPPSKAPVPQEKTGRIPPPPTGAGAAGTTGAAGAVSPRDKMQLERQVEDLQKQLMEEREKHLLQTIRSKEEEVTATKVEESIRSIQDKLRREKREQELQEALSKAEVHVRELERRIIEERETWMQTMKAQLAQRDMQDKDLEQGVQLRIKDLERRWQEEKNAWMQDLHYSEDELKKLKDDFLLKENEINRSWEKKTKVIESENAQLMDEVKMIKGDLQSKEKDLMSFKAQLTLYSAQVRQEKEKGEKYHQLINRLRRENEALLQKLTTQEKEYFVLKTQTGVLSVRAKAEQEKLSRELAELKEQVRQSKYQHEYGIKSKDDELKVSRENFAAKETELRNMLVKKEEEVRSKVKFLEEKNEELKQKLASGQQSSDSQRRVLEEKQDEIVKMKSILESKGGEISELKVSLKDVRGDIDGKVAKETDNFRRRMTHLEQLNTELQNQIISRDKSITEMLSHEEQIKRKYADRMKDIEEQFNQHKAKLQLSVSGKENEAAELRAKIDKAASSKKSLEGQTNTLKKDIDQREGVIRELKKNIGLLEEQVSAKRRDVIESEEVDKINKSWENRFAEQIKQYNQALNEANKNWEVKIAAKQKEIDETAEKVEAKWKGFHSKFVEEHQVLQEKFQQREQEIVELREKIGETENDTGKISPDAGEVASPNAAKGFWSWLNKPIVKSD
jgi:chromosome segregation ATPase